jgi:hypothetical protein
MSDDTQTETANGNNHVPDFDTIEVGDDETPVKSFENAEPPDRDVEHITDVLTSVKEGDKIVIVFGFGDHTIKKECKVHSVRSGGSKRDKNLDWDTVIELEGPKGDDDIGRMFRTGIGDEYVGPWFVMGYPHLKLLDMVKIDDVADHGWVSKAWIVDS